MSSVSSKNRVSSFIAQFVDLPANERYEIDEQIDRFLSDCKSNTAPPRFASYGQDLSPAACRILQRELMHEYSYLQHVKLDDSLFNTFREQVGQELVDTWFPERRGTETVARDQPVASAPPHVQGFEIHDAIGKGGTAIVYKATQLRFDRVVALKIPLDHSRAFSSQERQRFYDEARLQAKYLGAGVPAVFASSFGDYGCPYISMEYIVGEKLSVFFPTSPPSRTQCLEGIQRVANVCRALAPIHADGTLHLDLSGGNVYFDKQGNVKILDFGFGYGHGLKPFDRNAGTPDFMAPEKALGASSFKATTDVFSLGVFLAQMATGQRLFPSAQTDDEKINRLRAGKFDEIHAHLDRALQAKALPPALHQLTLQCLQFHAENRPQNAGQVAERIEAFFKSETDELQRLQVRRARQQVLRFSLIIVVSILVLASVFSVAFGIWANIERQRAQRNIQLRIDALETIVSIASSDELRKAGQDRLQKSLLERLVVLVDETAKSEKLDTDSLEQKAMSLNALTRIYQASQMVEKALDAAQDAEAIARELLKQNPASSAAQWELAISLSNQSVLLGMEGKAQPAIDNVKEAIERFSSLTANHVSASLYFHLALAENTLANILARQASQTPSISTPAEDLQPMRHYLIALGYIENAIEMSPKDSLFLSWRVKLLSNLAIGNGALPEGMKFALDAVKAARELNTQYPDDLDTRESLAVALTNEGTILLEGPKPRANDSVAPFREALELYVGLSTQVPRQTEFMWGVAMANSNLGAALAATASNTDELETASKHLQVADKTLRGLQQTAVDGSELQLYIDVNTARMKAVSEAFSP